MDFSVAMCVYGGDNPIWFSEAVDSILKQTLLPDKIILVVDGPVPDLLDREIKKCEDNPLFNVIRLEKNMGHGIARRKSLEFCETELVAIMDADDICVKDRFERQIEIFDNHPEISLTGGQITEFSGNTENVKGKRIVPLDDKDIKDYMKKRCPFNQPTVMFKKSDVQSVGGYIDWYCDEDYFLWLRMAKKGYKFANVKDTVVYMRTDDNSIKRRGGYKYFKSELKLQKYMLDNKIIGFGTYSVNVLKRFIIQVAVPNSVRKIIYEKFARER